MCNESAFVQNFACFSVQKRTYSGICSFCTVCALVTSYNLVRRSVSLICRLDLFSSFKVLWYVFISSVPQKCVCSTYPKNNGFSVHMWLCYEKKRGAKKKERIHTWSLCIEIWEKSWVVTELIISQGRKTDRMSAVCTWVTQQANVNLFEQNLEFRDLCNLEFSHGVNLIQWLYKGTRLNRFIKFEMKKDSIQTE